MAIRGWDNPVFKYVVRDSFNRANTATSTAGAVILAVVAHIIGVEGSKMLSADQFTRSVQIALAGFISIWMAIMVCRACWWSFHWRLVPHGGLLSFLRVRLGTFMWPVILTTAGFLAFVLLSGAGIIWLSLQVLNGASIATSSETPNTIGNPDFSLLVPKERYRFTWPSSTGMSFYVRLDTQRNPVIWNLPTFALRNRTNTVAYRVSATWKSETAMNINEAVNASPKLSRAEFTITDTSISIISKRDMPLPNFMYYLDDAPKQVIDVVAKEQEIFLPLQLWPTIAIYLVDRILDAIGETSPPFIARTTLEWETSEGKRQRSYRVRITATNAKASNSDLPIVDAYLNFGLEEIEQ
jgi:hypothetical protein